MTLRYKQYIKNCFEFSYLKVLVSPSFPVMLTFEHHFECILLYIPTQSVDKRVMITSYDKYLYIIAKITCHVVIL